MITKPVSDLTAKDFECFPVWEFNNDEETLPGRDETWVVPVVSVPVDDLSNRLISTSLRLRNGRRIPGFLGNVSLKNAHSTREFLTLSIWNENMWFHVARYFDENIAENGPTALAKHLTLSVNEVYPIAYDISGVANGLAEVIKGLVLAEPEIRLSDAQRIELIFE